MSSFGNALNYEPSPRVFMSKGMSFTWLLKRLEILNWIVWVLENCMVNNYTKFEFSNLRLRFFVRQWFCDLRSFERRSLFLFFSISKLLSLQPRLSLEFFLFKFPRLVSLENFYLFLSLYVLCADHLSDLLDFLQRFL